MLSADEAEAKLKAGRKTTVTQLRALADALAALPMGPELYEVLAWLAPPLKTLEREATLILGRQRLPDGSLAYPLRDEG